VWDAVQHSGQCIHGGVKPRRCWEAAQGRRWWCSLASVLKEEEEAGWGQKAEQAGRAAGSTGLKPEEETFSK
jgi:hypothetical protein